VRTLAEPLSKSGASARLVAHLLVRGASTRLEAVVAAAVFLGVAFLVYGGHISTGGFTLDDWGYAGEAERANGLLELFRNLMDSDRGVLSAGGRPLGAAYLALTHTLFGGTAELHLALAIVLAALVSWLLYLVLRELRMERVHAGAISMLVLLFPASDSVRLWPAAATSLVAISFFLLGLLLALRAFAAEGRRAIVLHGISLACYAASILQYEIASGCIVLAGLVYLVRTTRRAAFFRWLADLTVVASSLLYLRATTTRGVASVSDSFDRARNIQGEARQLLAQVGIQDGATRLPTVVSAVVILACVLLFLRVRREDPLRRELRRWLVTALAGVLAVGAGYVIFAGAADTFYMPLRPGFGNRTNAAATIGYCVLLYSLAMLAGLLLVKSVAVLRRAAPATGWASAFAVGVAAVLGVAWVVELDGDRRAWGRAEAIRAQTLDVLRTLPPPPSGTTVYTFGIAGETAPLVITFVGYWDLRGAVRVLWDDQSLRAVPSPTIERDAPGNAEDDWGIGCGRTAAEPRGFQWNPKDASAYGRTLFVDVPSGRHEVIRSERQCKAAVARYLRG